MSADEMRRVHYDALDFDDDLALLDGVPFSGLVYADYPDGSRDSEYLYDNGLPSGIQRRWFANGQLEKEWDAVRGKGVTWSRQWHANGMMRLDIIIGEDRFPISTREWDEDGRLLRDESRQGSSR